MVGSTSLAVTSSVFLVLSFIPSVFLCNTLLDVTYSLFLVLSLKISVVVFRVFQAVVNLGFVSLSFVP